MPRCVGWPSAMAVILLMILARTAGLRASTSGGLNFAVSELDSADSTWA